MAKKSKKALELEAENQARKEIIEAIKENAEEITSRSGSSELFQAIGGIKWLCSEGAWRQFFDEAYRVLEERNEDSDGNKQESAGT